MWRGRQSGLLSTGTIALALFVLGGFLIVTANLERLGAEWSSAAEMSVYLDDQITDQERSAIESALAPSEIVAAHEYVSKETALGASKRRSAISPDRSRRSARIRCPRPTRCVRTGPATEAGVEALGARLRGTPGVADVRYDRQWLTRLMSAIAVIRGVGLVMGAVLTIAAALTVASVVRLALHARRDEIEIMQLVGAPSAYIRGPFVMEGVIQGGVGALAAVVALAVAFSLRSALPRPAGGLR